jgi:hypothetical protein
MDRRQRKLRRAARGNFELVDPLEPLAELGAPGAADHDTR